MPTFRRSALSVLIVLALVTGLVAAAPNPAPLPARPGVTALQELVQLDGAESLRGVATYGTAYDTLSGPSATQVNALERLGLRTQTFDNLPLVLLEGPVGAMLDAVRTGAAYDVYPDRQLHYHWSRSNKAMQADVVHEDLGVTGKGVGVAIVDSGIDATHEALAQRVTHNQKIISPEYAGITGVVEPGPDEGPGPLVIPVDQGPYSNSDPGGGHGTHVAGIVAADGTGNPELVGVAPEADLIGYGAGDVLYIFSILASFDHVLEHAEEWNIRVVNNSWGSDYSAFDPGDPTNIATKALYDAGIAVFFSAGNSTDEMAINPNSVAPWVISVGSTDIRSNRSSFSSAGLMYDNSQPTGLEDGHATFRGDDMGLYHPDVSAPGSSIVSTGTPTGAIAASSPNGTATLSGTSMSSPQAAGLAALLFEANPDLTPDQIREVMQVTSVPFRDETPFWELGYGFLDALAAVELVSRPDFSAKKLARLQATRDAEVQDAREFAVVQSDHWSFPTPVGSVQGSEVRTFEFELDPSATALRATIAFPASLGVVGLNNFDWNLVVRDPDGNEVLQTGAPTANATAAAQVELEDVTPGVWTVEIVGNLALGQPSLLWSGTVDAVVTQLIPNA